MQCRLKIDKSDLTKIETEDRPDFVFFATHNQIIYRDKQFISMASCSGELICQVDLPPNHNQYEHLEFDDSVLFVMNGTHLVWIDFEGISPTTTILHPLKIGQCVTKLFHAKDKNGIIFGTKKLGKIQFVNYDFIANNRIAQTSSWEADEITSIRVEGNILHAILDTSTIVACDMSTGETLWTRFETGLVQRGLALIDGWIYYTSQGLLKKTNGETQKTIRIPLIRLSSIESSTGKTLYFTVKENKTLCRYDITSGRLVWKIQGQHTILDSTQALDEANNNLLLVRAPEYIGIISLDKGRAEANIRPGRIRRLRRTGDHILIHKENGSTTLVPGIEDD